MSKRALGAVALAAIVAAMLLAAQGDAAEAERSHIRYCENVALWETQARQGVDPHNRHGHPDYDGIADQHCPAR